MLENIIKKYHNNQIDTAQVIQELSEIAREMKLEDKKQKILDLRQRSMLSIQYFQKMIQLSF